MKNTMLDLHNHLFAELERLGDEDLTGEELKEEINRANALKGVAHEIVQNAAVVLKAESLRQEDGLSVPQMLSGEENKKSHPVLIFKENKA